MRNYDGLGGQLLFAYLHRHGHVHWTDNRLRIEWDRRRRGRRRAARGGLDLYRDGIDRSKLAQWGAAHDLVATLRPGRRRARGGRRTRGRYADVEDPRPYLDDVQPDEFPLSMFYTRSRASSRPRSTARLAPSSARSWPHERPRLEGRVIAVAGAGGSLGPVVVRALAAEGAGVAATDRDADLLASLGDAVAHTATADLVTPTARSPGATRSPATSARVHGLLHLVGGWRGGQALHEAPLGGPRPARAPALPHGRPHDPRLRRRPAAAGDRGRFALVSAAQAQRPSAGNAAYAAMKAAAEAWTLAFAQELAETGATANAVVINALVTPQMRAEHPEKAYRTFTDAEEIAEALVFLCSDAARKMTGQRLRAPRRLA